MDTDMLAKIGGVTEALLARRAGVLLVAVLLQVGRHHPLRLERLLTHWTLKPANNWRQREQHSLCFISFSYFFFLLSETDKGRAFISNNLNKIDWLWTPKIEAYFNFNSRREIDLPYFKVKLTTFINIIINFLLSNKLFLRLNLKCLKSQHYLYVISNKLF